MPRELCKLLDFQCFKLRAVSVDELPIQYQYSMTAYYYLNQQLILISTTWDAETLMQWECNVHYDRQSVKLTSKDVTSIQRQQASLIRKCIEEKTFIDMTTHSIHAELLELEKQYVNDAMSLVYYKAKKAVLSRLHDAMFFEYILPWYKKIGTVVDYKEYKAYPYLKKVIQYYKDNQSHSVYLIFKFSEDSVKD